MAFGFGFSHFTNEDTLEGDLHNMRDLSTHVAPRTRKIQDLYLKMAGSQSEIGVDCSFLISLASRQRSVAAFHCGKASVKALVCQLTIMIEMSLVDSW